MTTAEVAVEPTPERRLRTPLAYYALCLLAGLISLGLQLATGTDPTVALHLAAATTLGLLAVVVTGPLSIPGLLNLILVGKFLLVAVILKSLLFFEPMDVRLAAPLQTSRVMLLGFAGVFVASCLVSLIRTQRSTLPSLDQPEQYFWITFLLIFAGYGSWFLGKEHSLGGGAYSGGFWSLLQSLKIFGPVSVATAMLYVWKSGKKRYLSHPLVVATVIVGTAVGLVTTRKLEIMTPVFVLSDSYLANSAEPWRIPALDELPRMPRESGTLPDLGDFQPYARDPETLARPWAVPGTPGLEHRIGGLTKADVSGNVVYDPENHAKMIQLRAEKISRLAQDLPPLEIEGTRNAETLIVGWGGTRGAITAAIEASAEAGHPVAYVHLRHLNPLPRDLGEVLARYRNILVPELNSGQLAMLLRAEYLVDARSYTKIDGQPFKVGELADAIARTIGGEEI